MRDDAARKETFLIGLYARRHKLGSWLVRVPRLMHAWRMAHAEAHEALSAESKIDADSQPAARRHEVCQAHTWGHPEQASGMRCRCRLLRLPPHESRVHESLTSP